jgi:hypothetical protein
MAVPRGSWKDPLPVTPAHAEKVSMWSFIRVRSTRMAVQAQSHLFLERSPAAGGWCPWTTLSTDWSRCARTSFAFRPTWKQTARREHPQKSGSRPKEDFRQNSGSRRKTGSRGLQPLYDKSTEYRASIIGTTSASPSCCAAVSVFRMLPLRAVIRRALQPVQV